MVALTIIFWLTTGSMLSMGCAELITKEKLGNGASIILFINIIGGLPGNFTLSYSSSSLNLLSADIIYLVIVSIIVLVQESYKRVDIVSAKQLVTSSALKNSYVPIKVNQGGVMPLVLSTTVAGFFFNPFQLLIATFFNAESAYLTTILSFTYFILNFLLVIFFSTCYALLVLNPKDLSENLTKGSYSISGLKQGKETTRYLEQIISRLAFLEGIFLAILAFAPYFLENLLQFNGFKNLTFLTILIGVITDVTSRVKGDLIFKNYESSTQV